MLITDLEPHFVTALSDGHEMGRDMFDRTTYYRLPIPPEYGAENPFCFCNLQPGADCAGSPDDRGRWHCPSVVRVGV